MLAKLGRGLPTTLEEYKDHFIFPSIHSVTFEVVQYCNAKYWCLLVDRTVVFSPFVSRHRGQDAYELFCVLIFEAANTMTIPKRHTAQTIVLDRLYASLAGYSGDCVGVYPEYYWH